ncbi:FecR family protein, partial [uncultured Parasphingorhabdus sp.]|uniref:FecR family protein n=1 Tax=uncultured Parasphingorhabdus sp. TaxID=2709694 RepID=UPI0030DB0D75
MKKFLAIAAMMAAGTAHAGTPQWKLSESAGTVNILRAGVSKIAISGGSLAAGDVISTGQKSRAVLVRGQEYVVVSPNSRLRISEPKQSGGVVQFFEEIGNVLFRIDKKATPHFGVKTPYLAAVVKGTTFSVTVSETGTAVQVTEGAVQVSTLDGGASQLLSPGMIGIVNQDQQFRLTIAGAETKTIDSPNAPAGSTETPEPMDDATLLNIASSAFDGTISAPVLDTPVSLSALTGGLITNSESRSVPVQMASLTTPNPNFAIGNSGAINSIPGKVRSSNGSGGSNVSSAGGHSSSNAQGNSNAGGNGNSNAGGNGNSNAGGNGN